MLTVYKAMEIDSEFKQWVMEKITERPSRLHEKWFRTIIYEWAEKILKEVK